MNNSVAAAIFGTCLIIAALVFGLSSPNELTLQASESAQTITVTGTAEITEEPDIGKVVFKIESISNFVQEVRDDAAQRASNLMNTLEELGIEEKDIATSQFSLEYRNINNCDIRPKTEPDRTLPDRDQPDQEQTDRDNAESDRDGFSVGEPVICRYNQLRSAFVLTNVITVTVRDLEVTDQVLDAGITEADAEVQRVSFEVSDWDEDEMKAEAVGNARAQAEMLAEAAGAEIIGVQSIGSFAVPYYGRSVDSYEAQDGGPDVSTPINPGQQDMSVSVQVTFLLGDKQ